MFKLISLVFILSLVLSEVSAQRGRGRGRGRGGSSRVSGQCHDKARNRAEYRQCLEDLQKAAVRYKPLDLNREAAATGEGEATGDKTNVESESNIATNGRFSSLLSRTKGSSIGSGTSTLGLGSIGENNRGSLLSKLRGGAIGGTSQVTGETLTKDDNDGPLSRSTGSGSASGIGTNNRIELTGGSRLKNRLTGRSSSGDFQVVGGAKSGTGSASVSGSGSTQTTDRGTVSSGVSTGGATAIDGGAEVETGVASGANRQGGTAEGLSNCAGGICAAGSVSLTVTGPDGESINQSINTAQAKGRLKSTASTRSRVSQHG